MPQASFQAQGVPLVASMNVSDSEHKTFDDVALEDKRREEEKKNSLYNIYNIDKEKKEEEDVKILRSLYVSRLLWNSIRKFAYHSECSASGFIEKACMEYMKAHASELPLNVSFNLVAVQPKVKPKTCGVVHCSQKAVGVGVYLPRNKEYDLCEFHVNQYLKDPKTWKVKP
jgi:hypothetical protein